MSEFISVKSTLSNTNIILLLDTEASISLIKAGSISNTHNIDKSDIIKLKGITDQRVNSIGSTNGDIFIENVSITVKFHIVPDSFPIPSHGILGKNFIRENRCTLNYDSYILTVRPNNSHCVSIQIQSELLHGLSAVPPSSQTFRLFHISSKTFPCIIERQEIHDNVIVPTTIVHSPQAWIKVFNADDHIRLINTNKIEASPIENFDIYRSENIINPVNERDRLLEEILHDKIPNQSRHILWPLCKDFADIFYLDGDQATVNNFYEANLRLSDNQPVYIRNYRTPPAQLAEIKSQVSKLMQDDLIELSQSSYNSPLIIVPKKSTDGKPKFRMCVDYRTLNEKIIPDAFPMPRMDEILDGLGRAKYFSILDLKSGYHQIPLTEKSKSATAFSTNSGLYQWKVLPFGINVAPAHFSRMMKIAFSNLTPEEAFSYMDDLIVVGFSETQHIQNLRKVFEICRKRNLKLNSEKCQFFRNEVSFLGHLCTADGLKPDPNKIQVMLKFQRPQDKSEVKRFVAMTNYYRKFIENFSGLTQPLTYLTKKRAKFIWSPECERAFNTLKQKLTTTPILAYPDYSKEFKLTVDASNFACGGVLSQEHDGSDKPIAYVSKTFKKCEISKHITEKELKAIHFAIKSFRPYLWGRHLSVYSDHKPLIYLYKMRDPASRLTRIRLDLEEFDFDVVYIKGKDNIVADALSRISIHDLKDIYKENLINEDQEKNSEIVSAKGKIRSESQILAITRSMNMRANNNSVVEQRSDINCDSTGATEALGTRSKSNIPRIRTTNLAIDKGGNITFVSLTVYLKHKKLFNVSASLANEKLTLESILSKIENLASANNIKKNRMAIARRNLQNVHVRSIQTYKQ